MFEASDLLYGHIQTCKIRRFWYSKSYLVYLEVPTIAECWMHFTPPSSHCQLLFTGKEGFLKQTWFSERERPMCMNKVIVYTLFYKHCNSFAQAQISLSKSQIFWNGTLPYLTKWYLKCYLVWVQSLRNGVIVQISLFFDIHVSK